MLAKLDITLKCEGKLDYGISSLMQGILMEFIDTQYAEALHESNLKPYAQHIKFSDDQITWTITTLTSEAKKNIIDPILLSERDKLYIRHKDLELIIIKKNIETIAYKKLLDDTYFGDCSPYINIAFFTPTAFKVDGAYQFYPTVEHIFKSLIRKHDSIDGNTEVFSEKLIEEINKNVDIIRYKLQSTVFHLEGIRVPSFTGMIGIRVRGTKQFVNLINMLIEIGKYSGIGIKTAIGMGAIKTIEHSRKEG